MTPSETLKQAELETWLDSPWTRQFVQLLEARKKGLEEGWGSGGAYVYGEPAKTAENNAQYAARINELYGIIQSLTKREEPTQEIEDMLEEASEQEDSE